jgi:DNA primase small subunit
VSKPRPLSVPATRFLRDRFAQHYQRSPPPLPHRWGRREYGAIRWREDGGHYFERHLVLRDAGGMAVLAANPPHSAYVSGAYYRDPGAPFMPAKLWLGAALGFDVDADHLRTVQERLRAGPVSLADQLLESKRAARRILDEFLLEDLGLDARHIDVTFSGGRGYHVVATHEALLGLTSSQRREVCDYVTGRTLDPFLHIQSRGDREYLGSHGWPARLGCELADLLDRKVLQQPPEDAQVWLRGVEGITHEQARAFTEHLDRAALTRLRRGSLESGPVARRIFRLLLRERVAGACGGEPDEPITLDIHRLFRLPGSLHGGTGLLCRGVPLDELAGFDPLRDALAFGFEPIEVHALQDADVELAGQRVTMREGANVNVPEAHAVHFIATGAADIPTEAAHA